MLRSAKAIFATGVTLSVFALGMLAGTALSPEPAVAEPAVIIQEEANPDAEIDAYNRGLEAGKEIGRDEAN